MQQNRFDKQQVFEPVNSHGVSQIYDMQKGTRNGAGPILMGAAVANLTN